MTEKNGSTRNFQIRAFAPEDFNDLLKLFQTVEMELMGAPQTTEERLRQSLQWTRMRRWVVEAPGDPGRIIGCGLLFAQIKERSALDILVHPDWRRQGIGRRLLTHLLDEARAIGADYANFEVLDTSSAGLAFLRQAGFETFSHAWMLRASAEIDFPAPVWPEGYYARSYAEVNDLQTYVQAINRGYGSLWGHHENTAGGITAADAERIFQYFDPRAVFMVFAPDGSPVGASRVESAEEAEDAVDILDGPGIAPEHRHLKLQVPLALHALAYLRSLARRPVRLESWGDTPETIALYEALGFHVVEHYLAIRKDLRKE